MINTCEEDWQCEVGGVYPIDSAKDRFVMQVPIQNQFYLESDFAFLFRLFIPPCVLLLRFGGAIDVTFVKSVGIIKPLHFTA